MIGLLSGRVIHEELAGGVLLDVGGVGYELVCPVGTLGRAPRTSEGLVTLRVHTNLRQESLELFGFADETERATFRALITVPNVGPRTAVAILSALPAVELARVIEAEDKTRLGKVPGIGKKTAERLVLELRGKLSRDPSGEPARGEPPQRANAHDKLVLALVGLGYKPAEAERAAKSLPPEVTSEALGEQLRKALQFLAS